MGVIMEEIATLNAGLIPGEETNICNLIDQYINNYLESKDLKERTTENYKKALKQFFIYAKENIKEEPTRKDILAYKKYMETRFKSGTLSVYLSAVKGFFSFLQAEKICPNIASGVKGAKSSRTHKKGHLSTEQVKRVLCYLNENKSPEGLRNKALIMLLLTTGLRTIEIERANIEDLTEEAGNLFLYIQGKGRDEKDDYVNIDQATENALYKYIETRKAYKKEDPLFSSFSDRNNGGRLTTRSIRRIVKETLRAVGIDSEKLTAHSLRHTAVTMALKAGATLQQAQAMARHSNINTTLIYAHNIDREENAPEKMILNYILTH